MARTSPIDERELRAQGKRTMARLLDAGMTVLSDKGYHAARVDDVVKAADVSHGTFYLYFSNKQDLLRALAEQCADEMTDVISGLGPVDAGPAGVVELRSWLAAFFDAYRRYGVVIRAWMEDTANDRELVRLGEATFGSVATSLVTRIRDAGAPNVIDPDLAGAALLALIERYAYFVTSRGASTSTDDILDTLAALIHRGWFGG